MDSYISQKIKYIITFFTDLQRNLLVLLFDTIYLFGRICMI